MSELFPIESVTQDSPRLAWMKRHGVEIHPTPREMVGIEDYHGDRIEAFYAQRIGEVGYDKDVVGAGATENDALADWVRKHDERLWFEEAP